MTFEIFINFDGNCREAGEFYAKVFNSEVKGIMTYGEAPPDPNFTVAEEQKNKIMYADIQIGDMTVMLMDVLPDMGYVKGNNISPTLNTNDKDEIVRIFNALKEGGTVEQEPTTTFFSELYCMVTDKFGVSWQLLYYAR